MTITWQDQLEQSREVYKQSPSSNGAGVVYQRAVKLREVYQSPEFATHCREIQRTPLQVLNDEVGDLCCTFKVLMSVLDAYPKEADWAASRLDILAANAVLASRAEQQERVFSKPRVSWKAKYLELQLAYEELQTENARLRARYERENES